MRFVLVLITTMIGCSSKAAPPPEPKRTMHRVQAGTADASGWYPARSTNGKFSVLMPSTFNDFEMADKSEKGTPIQIHVVGTQLPDGVKYGATCMVGGDKQADVLTRMPAKLAPGQRVRTLTVAGRPAVEFTVPNRSASFRVVDLSTGMCLLTVEAQDKSKLAIPPQADVQRMFDSFELD